MTARFQGCTALVTGASRGLGRAIALELASGGASVIIGYRARRDEAVDVIAAVEALGGSARTLQLDLARPEEVERRARDLLDDGTPIDILVNNAAVMSAAPALLTSSTSWSEILTTNVLGAAALTRPIARHMATRQGGAIVNVSSLAARRGRSGLAAYGASKAAMECVTRTLAAELGPYGVRVNAVVPGLIDAGMTTRANRTDLDALAAQTPLRRLGTAVEVARAVAFLASDDASFVTGHCLVVDGGLSA